MEYKPVLYLQISIEDSESRFTVRSSLHLGKYPSQHITEILVYLCLSQDDLQYRTISLTINRGMDREKVVCVHSGTFQQQRIELHSLFSIAGKWRQLG